MKKIGKEVLMITTSEGNQRNGEGSFIRLKDGTIMLAYTEYYGENWFDHACARISAYFSYDNGETFTDKRILLEKDEDAKNYMSASLIRLADGALGMVFHRKSFKNGKMLCKQTFVRSDDEGKTWSDRIDVFEKDGYYCGVNDNVIVTREGEILVPAAYCGDEIAGPKGIQAKIRIASSKDNGKTFELLPIEAASPYTDGIGLQEPRIYQYETGDFIVYCRTAYGFQYEFELSKDKKSISAPIPNFNFSSPDSPMSVKKVGKYTAAVFNPISYNCLMEKLESWRSPKRTPFVLAISTDDGRSFSSKGKTFCEGELEDFSKCLYYLEDDRSESYCYPAIYDTGDGFLVAYFHSNKSGKCQNSTKVTKIYYDEIDQ